MMMLTYGGCCGVKTSTSLWMEDHLRIKIYQVVTSFALRRQVLRVKNCGHHLTHSNGCAAAANTLTEYNHFQQWENVGASQANEKDSL